MGRSYACKSKVSVEEAVSKKSPQVLVPPLGGRVEAVRQRPAVRAWYEHRSPYHLRALPRLTRPTAPSWPANRRTDSLAQTGRYCCTVT